MLLVFYMASEDKIIGLIIWGEGRYIKVRFPFSEFGSHWLKKIKKVRKMAFSGAYLRTEAEF